LSAANAFAKLPANTPVGQQQGLNCYQGTWKQTANGCANVANCKCPDLPKDPPAAGQNPKQLDCVSGPPSPPPSGPPAPPTSSCTPTQQAKCGCCIYEVDYVQCAGAGTASYRCQPDGTWLKSPNETCSIPCVGLNPADAKAMGCDLGPCNAGDTKICSCYRVSYKTVTNSCNAGCECQYRQDPENPGIGCPPCTPGVTTGCCPSGPKGQKFNLDCKAATTNCGGENCSWTWRENATPALSAWTATAGPSCVVPTMTTSGNDPSVWEWNTPCKNAGDCTWTCSAATKTFSLTSKCPAGCNECPPVTPEDIAACKNTLKNYVLNRVCGAKCLCCPPDYIPVKDNNKIFRPCEFNPPVDARGFCDLTKVFSLFEMKAKILNDLRFTPMSNIESESNPFDASRIEYNYSTDLNLIKNKLSDINSVKSRFNIVNPREKLVRPVDLIRNKLDSQKLEETIKIENKPLESNNEKERIKIKLKDPKLKPDLSDIFGDHENKE
jgi:hypothetical protein